MLLYTAAWYEEGSWDHIMGTDNLGRDLLSRLFYGGRISLIVGVTAMFATIVTGMSDREQAVKHVLHSAFSHSGQKCSATSLLILEEEVYEDLEFRRALCDAVRSLPVGSAWDRRTRVGPLIRPPDGVLETALSEGSNITVDAQEHGESVEVSVSDSGAMPSTMRISIASRPSALQKSIAVSRSGPVSSEMTA